MHMHDREQEKDKLITAGFLIIILCTYLQSACNGQDARMDPKTLKSKYNKTFGMKDRQRAETVNTVSGSDFMIAIS